MTGVRRFSLGPPDWGQDHLSPDAVVAYVDDELAAGAHARAETHLGCCAGCHAEVVDQRQARAALRAAGGPCLPSSLLRNLRSIPVEAELPPPPPGLGITADGQFVLLRDVPRAAPGPVGPAPVDPPPGRVGAPRRTSRRARFGAVSGLAIGALALGALATPGASAPPAPGVLGGAVLGGAQARLSAGPSPAYADPAVVRTPPDLPGDALRSPAVAESPPRNATVVDDSDDGAAAATALPTDATAVLDARLRARLDRSPVAFFTRP